LSLANLRPDAKVLIAMIHYPPLSAAMGPSRASAILEKHGIHICVFGHLRNIKADVSLFGTTRGIVY